jgi:chitin disaccharide deacetylase
MLQVNADDLGRTEEITDRILDCYRQGRIHSASAMTFMKDSERAAELSRKVALPVGLHLNLTQGFTGDSVPKILKEHHRKVASYLTAWKFNQILFNPFLHKAFVYVFQAQWDEFCRIYGKEPDQLDGHHHMHLCSNMMISGRLPKGIRIRRNFTFSPGEKDPVNRLYRYLVDLWLKSRFTCLDSFFSLEPIDRERLQRIVNMSNFSNVELMVHPGVGKEYSFLLSPEWTDILNGSLEGKERLNFGGRV